MKTHKSEWRERFDERFSYVGWWPEHKKDTLDFIESELSSQRQRMEDQFAIELGHAWAEAEIAGAKEERQRLVEDLREWIGKKKLDVDITEYRENREKVVARKCFNDALLEVLEKYVKGKLNGREAKDILSYNNKQRVGQYLQNIAYRKYYFETISGKKLGKGVNKDGK